MRRIGLAALVLAMGGCAAGGAAPEVHYTGALPGCALAASTLVRQGGQFAFAPGDGVLVIRGPVSPEGDFSGALNTQPPGKPAFWLSVSGTIGKETAVLDYATPRCQARATFMRVHRPLL